MPPVRPQAAAASQTRSSLPSQIIIRGAFIGSAHWITEARAYEPAQRNPQPERPEGMGGIAAQGEDPAEGNSELGALLAAITDDVHGRAAAVREGIRADFAGRIKHARKHVPGFARAAAVTALSEARKAALALVNQSAALELAGRKKAAIATFGTKSRKSETVRRLQIYTPLPPSH
jgi:hypothetical protein